MSTATAPPGATARPNQSNAYELFILVLTVLSLATMVALLWPRLSPQTLKLLQAYDAALCLIILFDFGLRMKRAASPRAYFNGERGWLDLLGSIPSFGLFKFGALLRLARLSRVAASRACSRASRRARWRRTCSPTAASTRGSSLCWRL